MLNIPAGLSPSPGTPLFCISSPKERDTPPIYNEMTTPSDEILEQSLQNLSPDGTRYVFVNSGCNKILQTE